MYVASDGNQAAKTTRARSLPVLFLMLLSGCGSSSDGDSDAFRFEDIDCTPDVLGGASVVAGQLIECTFRVTGVDDTAGQEVTLSCEDGGGDAIDCDNASSTQIQPFGSNPVPIENGYFSMGTTGLGGRTALVFWVADDGENRGRHRFEVMITGDDGENESPSIAIDCGGDTDGTVSVTAGESLACSIQFLDGDPDTLTWSYSVGGGNTPVSEPMPFGGSGTTPVMIDWTWDTDASEAGTSWSFTFSVNDGTAAAVTRDLTVDVQ